MDFDSINGYLWLFGGNDDNNNVDGGGNCNDLFMLSLTTSQWTWYIMLHQYTWHTQHATAKYYDITMP
jgi:hypothetical protein